MHPIIYQEFRNIASRERITGRILEIGAEPSDSALIAMPELSNCERIGINSALPSTVAGAPILQMNGNDMREFPENYFDAILSNATLEHDIRFWLTCAEFRRVLKYGGIAIIGVPGFSPEADLVNLDLRLNDQDGSDYNNATLTFRYHGAPLDYYRFSERAVRDLILHGFSDIEIRTVMMPPRLIGFGYKA